jgi:hypothetical protein
LSIQLPKQVSLAPTWGQFWTTWVDPQGEVFFRRVKLAPSGKLCSLGGFFTPRGEFSFMGCHRGDWSNGSRDRIPPGSFLITSRERRIESFSKIIVYKCRWEFSRAVSKWPIWEAVGWCLHTHTYVRKRILIHITTHVGFLSRACIATGCKYPT